MSKKKQETQTEMPIGKHKGKTLASIIAEEPSYLCWFFDTVEGYDDLKRAIAALPELPGEAGEAQGTEAAQGEDPRTEDRGGRVPHVRRRAQPGGTRFAMRRVVQRAGGLRSPQVRQQPSPVLLSLARRPRYGHRHPARKADPGEGTEHPVKRSRMPQEWRSMVGWRSTRKGETVAREGVAQRP